MLVAKSTFKSRNLTTSSACHLRIGALLFFLFEAGRLAESTGNLKPSGDRSGPRVGAGVPATGQPDERLEPLSGGDTGRPVGGKGGWTFGFVRTDRRGPQGSALFGQSVTVLDRKEERTNAGDSRAETGDFTACHLAFGSVGRIEAFGQRCTPVKESFGIPPPATRQPREGEDFGRNLLGVSRVQDVVSKPRPGQ